MLSYEDALSRLTATTPVLGSNHLSLTDADGLTLAEDITAKLTQPPFDASAMDGYAIRWEDRSGPWRVIGESAAGNGFSGTLSLHEAVRIFTGAPVPDGADTVIVQEDVLRDGDRLQLTRDGPPLKGAHIRSRGGDFMESTPLITSGTQLSPRHIGLAAAAGHDTLRVFRRARVSLIATGDELVPPGTQPGQGQIISSNGVMLSALLARTGADVRDFGIIRDDLATITDALAAAAADSDLLITIGGASVGDHDLVQQALKDVGADIDFWKVAIKPGKPVISGQVRDTKVIGLPGNPVSAYACGVLFVVPVLRRMMGRTSAQLPLQTAPLLAPLSQNGNRRDHIRAVLGDDGVRPAAVQDSAMLSTLAASNAFIIRPPGAKAANPGDLVDVMVLDRIYDTP